MVDGALQQGRRPLFSEGFFGLQPGSHEVLHQALLVCLWVGATVRRGKTNNTEGEMEPDRGKVTTIKKHD